MSTIFSASIFLAFILHRIRARGTQFYSLVRAKHRLFKSAPGLVVVGVVLVVRVGYLGMGLVMGLGEVECVYMCMCV